MIPTHGVIGGGTEELEHGQAALVSGRLKFPEVG